MNRIISKLITIWVQIRDLYLYVVRRAIVVNGYVDDHTWKGIRHRNWGDDLNYYFLKELTGRPIVFYNNFKLAKWLRFKNYLCIGTLLDGSAYKNEATIVWGSGASGENRGLSRPCIILSVRGQLTLDYLKKHSIISPESFGDPALLLPRVYQPERRAGDKFQVLSVASLGESEQSSNSSFKFQVSSSKVQSSKYKLGIIPHVVDQQHPVIQEIWQKYADEILIIDLAHYEHWTDVIDQICSCERILSSSLHGIIVSDAYQVPNCWIELTGNISGGHFKYLDYAASVGRTFDKPIKVNSVEELESLDVECASSQTISALQEGLLKTCPFKVLCLRF